MMDCEKKCQSILDWAEGKDWFDTEFVESILEQIDHGYEPTPAQEDAIDNIINRFNI
jgi:hypothetical protein